MFIERLLGYWWWSEQLLRKAGIDPDRPGTRVFFSTNDPSGIPVASFTHCSLRKELPGARGKIVMSIVEERDAPEACFAFETSYGKGESFAVLFVLVRGVLNTRSFELRAKYAGMAEAVSIPDCYEHDGFSRIEALIGDFLVRSHTPRELIRVAK